MVYCLPSGKGMQCVLLSAILAVASAKPYDAASPSTASAAGCKAYIDFGSSGPKVFELVGDTMNKLAKIDGPGCMTAFGEGTGAKNAEGTGLHLCREGNLVKEINDALQKSPNKPCEIQAVRATAGNRLVTVDNSKWELFKAKLHTKGIRYVSAGIETIPGTEEALNELSDALVQNPGKTFDGHFGWGGASLQLSFPANWATVAAVGGIALTKGEHFPGCKSGTDGCGADTKSDFFKVNVFSPRMQVNDAHTCMIPEHQSNANKLFGLVSFLSDRNNHDTTNIIGGNDETYYKVQEKCTEAVSSLTTLKATTSTANVRAALTAWIACMKSDKMLAAVGPFLKSKLSSWKPILVSQAKGNFERTGWKENVAAADLEQQPVDTLAWMVQSAQDVAADFERDGSGSQPCLVSVIEKMVTGDRKAKFFNGHVATDVMSKMELHDKATGAVTGYAPPAAFGAMYLGSVLSAILDSEEKAYDILKAGVVGDAEPIAGYLELELGIKPIFPQSSSISSDMEILTADLVELQRAL